MISNFTTSILVRSCLIVFAGIAVHGSLRAADIPLPVSRQQAASRTVAGRVTDAAGNPLVGVSVIEEGTANGVSTAADGTYALELLCGDDARLRFSFIGYEDQELAVGTKSTIDVRLAESVTEMDNVVVIGYGTTTKKELTGSVSSLLGAMNPIFIPILAAFFLHERITPAKIACVALSMAGVVVIVGVDGTVDASGALLMLASVFLWSTASIIIRRVSGRYDPMQIALIAILCALPFTGGWSLIELQSAPCSFTLESVLAVLYMGVLGTAVTHSLWNYSLRVMDASFCSMFYPMQPLVSSILGVLFLHEAVTPGFVIGALMICCGIVAAVISAKPRKA